MPVSARKERERAERHRLIVRTARDLAEAEGWGAVTTRRLAERIEYSQPVLYSHFRGKDEIVDAVAVEGFAELAVALRAAADGAEVGTAAGPRATATAVAHAYLAFAERSPALYDAMFSLHSGLVFADEATPAPLRAGFDALRGPLGETSAQVDPGLLTEVLWAGLHGLVTLTRAGRLPGEHTARRIEILVDRLTG